MMNTMTKQLGAAVLAASLCLSLAVPAFSAEGTPVTRSAFASAIWAREGKDSVTPAAPFTDVAIGDKNYTAILWCAENGLVSGTGKGSFFPGDAITREQAAIMVLNLAKHKADGVIAEAGLSACSDATEADIARLTHACKLSTVIDFRTTAEIKAGADPAMKGVTNTQINILGDSEESAGAITGIYGSDPIQALIDIVKTGQTGPTMYTSIIESEQALKGYGQFFAAALNQKEGALLWHCTGGKDRAGTAAQLTTLRDRCLTK